MLSSIHNIRRPAFWLVLSCLGAIGFFVLTDPRAGLLTYSTPNPIDALRQAEIGTMVGVVGSGLILLVALFLCTRKGSPPTMERAKAKS
jgi:hypothetical protein